MARLSLSFISLLTAVLRVSAQAYQFTYDGYVSGVTADTNDFNSGGSITVAGNVITVPKNLQVQLPGTFVPFPDFAKGNRGTAPIEVLVTGNNVNGKLIAAQVQVSGLLAQTSTGKIASLNTDGTIAIANGPNVRINTPNGVYAAAFTGLPLFTADEGNPSISSFAGFPMCVPKAGDTKCLNSNRPAGTAGIDIPDAKAKDMVPFAVGDYITYSGVEFGGAFVAYAITANVGLYSEAPGYLFVEDVIIGVADPTNNPNLEPGKSRFGGYTTSNRAIVSVNALDVDPCTGDITERQIGTATPERTPIHGRYKWELRLDVVPPPYTQQYRMKLSTGQIDTNTEGIIGGQYDSPVTEWIFPEVITPGAPVPPFDFTNLGFLVNGPGPDDSGNVFSQLSPWPDTTAPAAKNCPPKSTTTDTTPVIFTASATGPQSARPGVAVLFTATQSNATLNAQDFSFSWTQVSGPTGTLTGANKATVTFAPKAPQTPDKGSDVLQVSITHVPSGTVKNSTVTLATDNALKDHVTVDSYTFVNKQGGTIDVQAHSDLVADASASMTITLGTSTTQIQMTNVGPGIWSFNQRSTAKPASIKVSSFAKLPNGTTQALDSKTLTATTA